MTRSRAAVALATSAVALLFVAVAYGVVAAIDGAHLVVVAPAAGTAIGLGVWMALRRVCTTGSRSADVAAGVGIIVLPVLAVLGASLGGFTLLVPTALLAIAYALTPRSL